VNRLLGQVRGALFRAGDLEACEQIRRARVPILKVRLLLPPCMRLPRCGVSAAAPSLARVLAGEVLSSAGDAREKTW
jgi:hypothetical protein